MIAIVLGKWNRDKQKEQIIMNKTIDEMDRDEKSLLLYMESCSVDSNCKLNSQRMNEADFDNAEAWNKSGYVEFGRMSADSIIAQDSYYKNDHYVIMSEQAWKDAHLLRRARGARAIERLNETFEKYPKRIR